MPDPIVIVSGWMRSGTTMMMQCLQAGGIEVVRDPDNPDWELGRPNYELHRTPEVYEGKAVKSLRIGPGRMRPWAGGYRLIFMRRPPREQLESYIARFGKRLPLEVIEYEVRLAMELAYNRRDTEVLELDYEAVVGWPKLSMARVRDFVGLPFDYLAAAQVVDPELKHWTIEELPGYEPLDELDAAAAMQQERMLAGARG